MTLQEAINHAKETASKLGNCECAQQHLQLAGWLTDLLNLMENGYSHFTKEIDKNYQIFVPAALQGRLSANPEISSKEAAKLAIEDAKELILQLKLTYEYK